MLYDVTRCVDFLEQREDVDRDRIGVVGHSQGGILANFVLGIEPRVEGRRRILRLWTVPHG